MSNTTTQSGAPSPSYAFSSAAPSHAHSYLLPAVQQLLEHQAEGLAEPERRLFDLGCGNGSVTAWVHDLGWSVIGVDPSENGIMHARVAYPHITIQRGSAYDDLATQFGTFPVVLSLEVVEHLYDPRRYAQTLFSLVEPGGIAIISTPYHGYLKNLALALTGKMDAHFTALWDHGHIKFWSIASLSTLLTEAGFKDLRFNRVGRVPQLAKSMIAVAHKPKR